MHSHVKVLMYKSSHIRCSCIKLFEYKGVSVQGVGVQRACEGVRICTVSLSSLFLVAE